MNEYVLINDNSYTVENTFSYGTSATQTSADIGVGEGLILSGYSPFVHIHLSGCFDAVEPEGFIVNWYDGANGYSSSDKITTSFNSFSASHDYVLPGYYKISFTGLDSLSDIMTTPHASTRVYVEELPPTVGSIEISGDNSFTAPYTVSAKLTAISAGSFPIERIEFDFGDDTTIEKLTTFSINTPLSSAVTHTYTTEGNYIISANVYASNTNTMVSQTATLSVTNSQQFSAFCPDGLTLKDVRMVEDGDGLVYVFSDNTSKTAYNMYLPIYRYDVFNFNDTLIYYIFDANSTVSLNLVKLIDEPIKIEWGDGSYDVILENLGNVTLNHTFNSAITSYIRIKCDTVGAFNFGKKEGITEYNIFNNEFNDNITSVSLSRAVNVVSTFSFAGLRNLVSVSIGSDTTSIEERAFYYCPSLESIIIPNSTRYVKDMAFYGCKNLTEASVLGNVVDFGYLVFNGCENLVYFNLPTGTTVIPYGMFSGATRLRNVDLNETGVTEIGYGAFSNCTSMFTFEIPSTIESIGRGAFYNCTDLSQLYFYSTTPTFTIGDEAFAQCTNLTTIHVPNGETSNYEAYLPYFPPSCTIVDDL